MWLGSSVGKSARTVCERSWVRVPVGSCSFSSPVTHMQVINNNTPHNGTKYKGKMNFVHFEQLDAQV